MKKFGANGRLTVLMIGFVAGSSIATIVFIQHVRREPILGDNVTGAAASATISVANKQAKHPAALTLTRPPAPSEGSDDWPAFDVARIKPTGEAVVAGRAPPDATVELLRNGELHDRGIADRSGRFVMTPPPLPPGTYDLSLRSKLPDGKQIELKQSVTVVLEPNIAHPFGHSPDEAGKARCSTVKAGSAKAGNRCSDCGDGQGLIRRQVRGKRPRAHRFTAKALSQRHLYYRGDGGGRRTLCGHNR